MVTLSSAENALKTVYLGVVANQLNINANPLLGKIKQSTKDVWGKEVRKLAPYGINGGIGAGSVLCQRPLETTMFSSFLNLKTYMAKLNFPTRQLGRHKTVQALLLTF